VETSNDDVILQACQKFQDDHLGGPKVEDGVRVLTVVLLTGDRNLRVKAHASGIPSLALAEFCQRAAALPSR
jgi:hypothetical protein